MNVLLQIAIRFSGVNCRLLFDSGAQLSYVYPTLFIKLNFKPEGTQRFKLNVFGTKSTVENLDYVKVKNFVCDKHATVVTLIN